jgi:hypothetical protein
LAIASFLQLLRPITLEDQRAVRFYRGHVETASTQVRQVFDAWVALREIEPDYARLANAASVNRWEMLRLAEQIKRLRPPRALSGVQRNVMSTVVAAARACQLLANGYRFHKSEAICDGQALLVDIVENLDDLILQIDAR